MKKPTNLLIIMTDEHTRKVAGCYGNQHVQTPNIDSLAEGGVLFSNGYSPSPICVPARALIATGRHVHETHHWDNAAPYAGIPESWGHILQKAGHSVESIGKLHFRKKEDPLGFDHQHLPVHVVNGIGDLLGAVRDSLPERCKTRNMAEKIGPGETSYTKYDRRVCDDTVSWLEAQAQSKSLTEKPWTLFTSFIAPHFPLIAPEKYYNLYGNSGLMPQKQQLLPDEEHPWFNAFRSSFPYDNFTTERTRVALASYFGLVSFVDDLIGKVLNTLKRTGLDRTTRVLYTSDHGDNIGERGLWGKSNFYEEAAGIPMILSGPEIPQGETCHTPVSLYDVFPTVTHSAGISGGEPEDGRSGRSLMSIAAEPYQEERIVFGEYHAAGATSAAYMLRRGRYKYIHYVGFAPQLFDLQNDPEELCDLAAYPGYKKQLADFESELRSIVDPEAIDQLAKSEQAALIEQHGGREKIVKDGGFGATPAYGEKAEYE
jgi:choline-sulfatase